MNTIEQLTQIFNDNFVAYYRSHVAHVNIEGRNFYSDHKLLQKIYEDLQDQIDSIAEKIRTLGDYMPCEIQDVLNNSHVSTGIFEGDSDYLLQNVEIDLEHLKNEYLELSNISEQEDYVEIANYAQDRITTLNKFIWTDEPKVDVVMTDVDLSLSPRLRIQLIKDMMSTWEYFAKLYNINIVVSGTTRRNQSAYLKLHERNGYELRGSWAIKLLNTVQATPAN